MIKGHGKVSWWLVASGCLYKRSGRRMDALGNGWVSRQTEEWLRESQAGWTGGGQASLEIRLPVGRNPWPPTLRCVCPPAPYTGRTRKGPRRACIGGQVPYVYTAVAPDLSPWVTGLRALRHTDTAWWKDTWLQMIFSDYPRNVPLCRPASCTSTSPDTSSLQSQGGGRGRDPSRAGGSRFEELRVQPVDNRRSSSEHRVLERGCEG